MPACLEIFICFHEEKNKWGFQWIWLSLGQARYVFCLNLCKWWVSFGFNMNGTWLCKLWFQIQFLSTVKEKKGHLDWTLKKQASIKKLHWDCLLLYFFHPISLSFDAFYHSLSLSLFLSLSKLRASSIVGLLTDFSITQVFILC